MIHHCPQCQAHSISYRMCLTGVAFVLWMGTAGHAQMPNVDAQTPITVNVPEVQLRQLLARPVSCDFDKTPLNSAVDELARIAQCEIRLDTVALNDAVIEEDSPVTLRSTEQPLQQVLEALLEQLELAWLVRHGVLYVTTDDVRDEQLVIRVYPVSDLVTYRDGSKVEYDLISLVELIISCVEPNSWLENGGNGTIEEHVESMSLVVGQSWQVHQLLERTLTAMRSARRAQPVDWDRLVRPRYELSQPRGPATQVQRRRVYHDQAAWRTPRTYRDSK